VPPGGSIDKNSQGELTGVLRDAAASLIWQAVPEPTVEDLTSATQLALQKILEAGLTSIHWLVLSPVELDIIQTLHHQNKLPLRVNVVVPENLIEKAQKLQTSDPTMLRFGGVTINVDGYLDSKEAALIKPYSDDPLNTGKLLCAGEALAASVRRVLEAGVQPIIVAMGDRAIDEALRVIEQTSLVDVRFRIEQAAVLNEDLVERLKKQRVVVSIQPKMISTEFTVWSAQQRLGERARWLHPLKSLVDAGVKVVGGSDCPMEPLNPFLGMQEAVFREAYPEQRLSVVDALRMYTLDAAYSTGEECVKGSIEEGKLADFTVLASNPEIVAPAKIKDIRVDTVIVAGKIIRDNP
jgi:predicted amidohydrolase YtcJ